MTVRIGVVGAGWVSKARHIRSFAAHPDAQVVSIFDRHPDRAAALARELGIPHWTSTMDEMLDQELDVLSIATPPWTHAELAVQALQRGLHVFTEKPMAMNASEAHEMVATAETAGRLLCVSHNFLFSRSARSVRRFLGPDPDILYATAVQLSSLRRRLPTWISQLPGGLLFDEMPHVIYLLQGFLGPITVEDVRIERPSAESAVRAVEVWVRGRHAPGQIVMVADAPISEWQVVLVGSRGVAVLDLFRDIALRVRPDGAHRPLDILKTSARMVGDHAVGFAASGTRYVSGRLFWGHDTLIMEFVDAILGRRALPVPAEEALGVVRVTDRIVEELVRNPGG